MKRLLLTADLVTRGDTGAETASVYVKALNTVYAHLHNLKFEAVQYAKDTVEDRHFSWARIPLLQKYIDQYDEILWLNPTVAILDLSKDVFEALKTAPESKWTRLGSTKPVGYTVADKPANDSNASTNILLLDCRDKAAAKAFLNDWWNDLSDLRYAKRFPYEEVVWNFVWKNDLIKASQLRVADIPTMYESENQLFLDFLPAMGAIQLTLVKKYFYKQIHSKNPCSKRIAIYMRPQDLYTNGAGQNCIFMKHAFEATGHFVDLVVPYKPKIATPFVASEIKYTYLEFNTLDLSRYCLCVFGSGIPPDDQIAKMKDAGVRTVVYTAGNILDNFHIDFFLGLKKAPELPLLESKFHTFADECWIPDTHTMPNLDYLATLNRNKIPIKTVPHVWSPLFTLTNGVLPQYKPRLGKKVDIVIFEPNINHVKCGLAPLMIAETLHLAHPDAINKVYFFNKPDNEAATSMIHSTKLYEEGKIRLIQRMQINEILAFFANPAKNGGNHVVFLIHQTYLPYNYAYYDVLASGFPLVHNSTPLFEKGLGSYYTDFSSGVDAILNFMKPFDHAAYVAKANVYLEKHHCPYNSEVVKVFASRLLCQTVPNYLDQVQMLILNATKERKESMKKMFSDLGLTISYDFFDAFVPETSASYLNYKRIDYPEPEGLVCCSRSHAAALHAFATDPKYASKSIVCIVEDDVLFSKNFEKELQATIESWKKHDKEIDFVSIGYSTKDIKTEKSDGGLHWGAKGVEGALWGAQAYMVNRRVAAEMAPVLHQPSAQHLFESMLQYIQKHNGGQKYAAKALQLSPDSFLSILWRQGFVNPSLAIENPAEKSLISGTSNTVRLGTTLRPMSDFYGAPASTAPMLTIFE